MPNTSLQVCCWKWVLSKYAPQVVFKPEDQGTLDYQNCLAAPQLFGCSASSSSGNSGSSGTGSSGNNGSSSTQPTNTPTTGGTGSKGTTTINVTVGQGGQSNAACASCTGITNFSGCIPCASSVLTQGLDRIAVNLLLGLLLLFGIYLLFREPINRTVKIVGEKTGEAIKTGTEVAAVA